MISFTPKQQSSHHGRREKEASWNGHVSVPRPLLPAEGSWLAGDDGLGEIFIDSLERVPSVEQKLLVIFGFQIVQGLHIHFFNDRFLFLKFLNIYINIYYINVCFYFYLYKFDYGFIDTFKYVYLDLFLGLTTL